VGAIEEVIVFAQDRRIKILTLVAMCFGMFLIQLDLTIVNVALPKIQATLGTSVSGLQWVVDAYALVFASLLLIGGGLGDLYGRKRILLIGLVVFTLGSAICGAAPTLAILILGRAIQGVGAALQLSCSLSILSATFPDAKERAQAVGLWASISGIGFVGGPVVGGLLVDTLGWPSVFYLNIPIGALAVALSLRVRESSDPEERRLDVPGQVLSVLWLGCLVFAVIEGNARGWHSPVIIGAFLIAAAGFVLFLVVERRSAHPLLVLDFFREPTFAGTNLVALLMVLSIYGTLFLLTLFFQGVQGYSAIGTGLRLLPMTGALIVGSPIAGRIAGTLGYRLPMAAGMAAAGIGLLLLTRLTVTGAYGWVGLLLALTGLGTGFAMATYVGAAVGAVPPERSGMASGVINTSRQTGGALGVALLGALLTSRVAAVLPTSLDRLGVAPAGRSALVKTAAHGGTGDAGALPPGVARAMHDAFVSGMHLAVVVGGVLLLVGALVALCFVRQQSTEWGAARQEAGEARARDEMVATRGSRL
jgi:DHA2 family methylenomycin A resistance protein-like MFS transporter